MPYTGVRVEGYTELNRAFGRLGKDVKRELTKELAAAAEPVRATAEQLAHDEIRNIGDRWSQMRVGVTTRLVYVAPKQRGVKVGSRKRKNLAGLLMDKAMSPALEQREPEVVALLDVALGRLAGENGF